MCFLITCFDFAVVAIIQFLKSLITMYKQLDINTGGGLNPNEKSS